LIYGFTRQGIYEFRGVLVQARVGGTFEYKVVARGTASANGNVLVLHPSRRVAYVHDPGHHDRKRKLSTARERYH
jgi:hypothetical protein